jgi:dTMP kinase
MKHATYSNDRPQLTDVNEPGLLIAFEGLDGSGKTTQRKLLKSWLETMQEDVVVTKWNSSPLFKPLIKERKAARLLDPTDYAVLHAADFWHRYEMEILPALTSGKIVLADRYVFTGIARDIARGMAPGWCNQLYAGVRMPDMVLYFKARTETCAMRIAASREIKFYESGQDVTGLDDPYQSYMQFAPNVTAEYDRLQEQFGFVMVDAEKPVYDQHRFIRDAYFKYAIRKLPEFAIEHCLNPVLS